MRAHENLMRAKRPQCTSGMFKFKTVFVFDMDFSVGPVEISMGSDHVFCAESTFSDICNAALDKSTVAGCVSEGLSSFVLLMWKKKW